MQNHPERVGPELSSTEGPVNGGTASGLADADRSASIPPAAPAPLLELARTDARQITVLAVLAVVIVLFLLPPASFAGLWDPHELRGADLARRVALNLHGAQGLALEGTDNSLPHLNDLGRPQLAFTSMALGFKLFGLHEWAGRLPLTIWAALGALALFGALSRLVHPRAGLFAAIALATTPLYFVQARTMLGDIVAMSALAIAWSGLSVAVFDDDSPLTTRLAWFLVGGVGLAAGFGSRGALLGVAVPLLAVGLSWGLAQSQGRGGHLFARAVGALAIVGGFAIVVRSFLALRTLGPESDLSPWIGALIHPPAKLPTFDVILAHIGHSCAPWSAFVPFALGRLFWASTWNDRGGAGAIEWRRSVAKTAILLGASIAVVLEGSLYAYTDVTAFTGVALLAAAVGVALFDYERGAHASLVVGLGTLVLAVVVQHDFSTLPEKGFQAFSVLSTQFPEALKPRAGLVWKAVMFGFGLIAVLTFLEQHSDRRTFDSDRYFGMIRSVRLLNGGSLALAYFAVVATTSVAGLAVWIGTRFHVPFVVGLPLNLRERITLAWWAVALAPGAVFFGVLLLCDVWHFVFSGAGALGKRSLVRGLLPIAWLVDRAQTRSREGLSFLEDGPRVVAALCLVALFAIVVGPAALLVPEHRALAAVGGLCAVPVVFAALGLFGDLLRGSRAAALLVGGALLGSFLAVDYYPALANQLSPREVFAAYRTARKPGEPLALLNVGGKTVAYYAGESPTQFGDVGAAARWLEEGTEGAPRRFLVLRGEDLVRLNQAWRERTGQNVALLDARSSQILLATSALTGNEKSQSPLDAILLKAPPTPSHPLDVDLEGKLKVLGFDVVNGEGKLVDYVTTSKEYSLRFYYQVTAKVERDWEGFIHIDGQKRRYNGDHKLCNGKYPTTAWLPGDIVVDEHKFTLEPNFTPSDYDVFFGLWASGDLRMKVVSGASDGDNRIHGGKLKVR